MFNTSNYQEMYANIRLLFSFWARAQISPVCSRYNKNWPILTDRTVHAPPPGVGLTVSTLAANLGHLCVSGRTLFPSLLIFLLSGKWLEFVHFEVGGSCRLQALFGRVFNVRMSCYLRSVEAVLRASLRWPYGSQSPSAPPMTDFGRVLYLLKLVIKDHVGEGWGWQMLQMFPLFSIIR